MHMSCGVRFLHTCVNAIVKREGCAAISLSRFPYQLGPQIQFAPLSSIKQVNSGKKRAPGAFLLFLSQNTNKFKGEISGPFNLPIYINIASKAWNSLTRDQRDEYIKQAAEEQRKLDEEYQTLSEEEKEELRSTRQERLDRRHKTERRKEQWSSGKPRPRLNAWQLFAQQALKGGKFRGFQHVSDEFRSLSTEETMRYEKLAREDQARYTREMITWTAQLVAEGREHLSTSTNISKYRRLASKSNGDRQT